MNDSKSKVLSGLIWKFSERMAAQLVTLGVTIVLAKLVPPSEHGIIAIVNIFIAIANCIVVNGLGSSLIQKKDADDLDFSTVLYFQIALSVVLYAAIYFGAPLVPKFFSNENNNISADLLISVLRVLGLRIPLTAINNVQQAYVARKMIFRKFFLSTFSATVVSGVVGIYMAYKGYGVWALVIQYLVNTTLSTIILAFTLHWLPKLKFSFERLKSLLKYGWKVLIAGLVNEFYNETRSIVIGKKYSSDDLAFFDKGKQIPNIIVTNINTTISNVLFPAIANAQSNIADVKNMMRRSIKTSSFIMCPMMFGLAVVAEPLIKILLTEEWLPCVPFMQIYCISFCFEPIQTANLQAIKAVGRSDIFLVLEVIKKGSGLIILFAVMNYGVNAIAYSLLLTTLIAAIVNTAPNKKLIGYSYGELLKDIAPGVLISAAMSVLVYVEGLFLPLHPFIILLIQAATGAIFYFAVSSIFKVEAFTYLWDTVIEFIGKKKNKAEEA